MQAIVEERWREQRRDRMLDAAATVFSRHAFHQASMDEIAQEAGVAKPTLYRYFGSKDALFGAVFETALDELEARLAAVLQRPLGVEGQMKALVAEIVPMFRDHLIVRLMDDKGADADRSKRRIFRERRARIGAYLAAALDAGIRAGELRAVDPHRVARLLVGAAWSASAMSDDPAPTIAREVTDLVLLGLAVRTERRAVSGRKAAATGRELAGEAA